jgi:hypothetical protein
MVNKLLEIIITLGGFFGNLKSIYLKWVQNRRQKTQNKLEDKVKKEVDKGEIDDLNKRLMK